MKNINLYFFVITLFFWGSCNVEDEPIPAYIHVKPFLINVNPDQGTGESKITDAWVSNLSNGDFLGAYEVPATFPILEAGTTNLIIEPGIKVNGISATPDRYPMFERFEVEVELEGNITDTIQPVTSYKSDVEFFYIEDFDNSNKLDVEIDTLSIIPSPSAGGAFGGQGRSFSFTLDETNTQLQVASSQRMEIPTDRGETFLEIHYKSEGILQLGLVGYQLGQLDGKGALTYIIALNPKETWNKLYLELTNDIINVAQGIVEFQVLVGAQHDPSLTSTSFSIDNIKVLYRSTSN